MSIKIFFNLELLTDQIQQRVNLSLRSLFQCWKAQIFGLNDAIKQVETKEEEIMLIDQAIGKVVTEMIQQTLRTYTLSLSLSDRDPASKFEGIEQNLQKTGYNNIFNLFWEKLVHILKSSIQKFESNQIYIYLF